ncbi:hypothetical protein [Serratia liquefaciens]|uniref:hypothetical protein n=1 Tax=Serratia liquefaciens TaxID=614 RepID=UPI000E06BDF4|nr:hypothetical protein [Serratia liquefaciens]RYM87938.1 hypothetical protein BSR02_05480 [Serratia liquefaciens]SUI60022.1 Uncharacterised protein [Serratia liquefaciens]
MAQILLFGYGFDGCIIEHKYPTEKVFVNADTKFVRYGAVKPELTPGVNRFEVCTQRIGEDTFVYAVNRTTQPDEIYQSIHRFRPDPL